MRYLVLTDIHANLEAFDTCLADARTHGFDASLILGDLVGYGGDPHAIVRGNHDKVACGLDQADGFNAVAKSAAKWTLDVLTPAHRDWLCALPEGPYQVDEMVEICHGSPFDEDAYIFDELDAVRALKVSTRPLCLFGHTHYPIAFELKSDQSIDSIASASAPEVHIDMKAGSKYLVNPGSVGQPRDGDPRAAYAIVDTTAKRVELYRLRYPIADAQAKVIKAGLPEVLAQRLAVGR
jgi:diadenosine tetraphosphatase ApaH/serine/threonine PP2A family protein phosphatase